MRKFNDKENVNIFGIKPIAEMTKDELIEEIIEVNRVELLKMELPPLKANVTQLRLTDYKQRLLKDAGLRETGLGIIAIEDSSDDD